MKPSLLSLAFLAGTSALALAADPLPFPNPGFESGRDGWNVAKDDEAAGISKVSPEAAHGGANGLRVKQDATGPGSWLQSSKIAVEPGKNYILSFWGRCVEESGIGIWVQAYNADGKPITPADPKSLIYLIPSQAKDWAEYRFPVAVPEGAVSITLAIHAFSKHACLADFDDFAVTPAP